MSLDNVREFSNNGKYFAFINNQGKFVVYDVELNTVIQVYTPNLHLSVPCTCFTWISVGQESTKEKTPKSKKFKGEGQFYVAFGTSKGGIALYSLTSAKIERTFKGEGHSGPVTCIFADKANLYTAGTDGKVIQWAISSSKQKNVFNLGVEKLSCLSVFGDLKFVTGSKQLKLWEDDEIMSTLVGHTSSTVILKKFAYDGSFYAVSASKYDRTLSLWLLDGEKKAPIASFLMDDAASYLCVKMVENKLNLLAVSKSGVIHYFIQNFNKLKATKPVKAKFTLEIAADSTASKIVERVPAFTATLEYGLNEDELLIGYGTEQCLRFEKITLDKETKNNVLVRENPKTFTKKEDLQTDQSFKKKTPITDDVEYMDNVLASKKTLKTIEIPMEARLENLSLVTDSSQKPHAKNMAQLLIQGLHSRDASILKLVFAKCDEESIKVTLQKLPPQYVSALLQEISLLMQQKTEKVSTSVLWLKFLIQIHASQLMALGSQNFLANFGTCLGIIEYRVEHLRSLSKLSGRLDLLLNQIDKNKISEEIHDKNLLVFQEEDSDVDSVIEKDENNSSSEERWEESAEESDDNENDQENIVDEDDEMKISDSD